MNYEYDYAKPILYATNDEMLEAAEMGVRESPIPINLDYPRIAIGPKDSSGKKGSRYEKHVNKAIPWPEVKAMLQTGTTMKYTYDTSKELQEGDIAECISDDNRRYRTKGKLYIVQPGIKYFDDPTGSLSSMPRAQFKRLKTKTVRKAVSGDHVICTNWHGGYFTTAQIYIIGGMDNEGAEVTLQRINNNSNNFKVLCRETTQREPMKYTYNYEKPIRYETEEEQREAVKMGVKEIYVPGEYPKVGSGDNTTWGPGEQPEYGQYMYKSISWLEVKTALQNVEPLKPDPTKKYEYDYGRPISYASHEEEQEAKDMGIKGVVTGYALESYPRIGIDDNHTGSILEPKYAEAQVNAISWSEVRALLLESQLEPTMSHTYDYKKPILYTAEKEEQEAVDMGIKSVMLGEDYPKIGVHRSATYSTANGKVYTDLLPTTIPWSEVKAQLLGGVAQYGDMKLAKIGDTMERIAGGLSFSTKGKRYTILGIDVAGNSVRWNDDQGGTTSSSLDKWALVTHLSQQSVYEYGNIEEGKAGDIVEFVGDMFLSEGNSQFNEGSWTVGKFYILQHDINMGNREGFHGSSISGGVETTFDDRGSTSNGWAAALFRLVKTKPGSEAVEGDQCIVIGGAVAGYEHGTIITQRRNGQYIYPADTTHSLAMENFRVLCRALPQPRPQSRVPKHIRCTTDELFQLTKGRIYEVSGMTMDLAYKIDDDEGNACNLHQSYAAPVPSTYKMDVRNAVEGDYVRALANNGPAGYAKGELYRVIDRKGVGVYIATHKTSTHQIRFKEFELVNHEVTDEQFQEILEKGASMATQYVRCNSTVTNNLVYGMVYEVLKYKDSIYTLIGKDGEEHTANKCYLTTAPSTYIADVSEAVEGDFIRATRTSKTAGYKKGKIYKVIKRNSADIYIKPKKAMEWVILPTDFELVSHAVSDEEFTKLQKEEAAMGFYPNPYTKTTSTNTTYSSRGFDSEAPKPPEKPLPQRTIWQNPKSKAYNRKPIKDGARVLVDGLEVLQIANNEGEKIRLVGQHTLYPKSRVYPVYLQPTDYTPQIGDVLIYGEDEGILTAFDAGALKVKMGEDIRTFAKDTIPLSIYSRQPLELTYSMYKCGEIECEDTLYTNVKALEAARTDVKLVRKKLDYTREYRDISKMYDIPVQDLVPKDEVIMELIHEALDHPLNVEVREWCMVVGPSGSGKSVAAVQYANDVKREYIKIACTSQLTVDDLLGYRSITTGEYFHSLLQDAVENGKVLILDEIDASNPNTMLAINDLKKDMFQFVEKSVKVHDDFRIIATANTLTYDEEYNGRQPMDKASIARYDVIIYGMEPQELAIRYGSKYMKEVTIETTDTPRSIERKVRKLRIKEIKDAV